MKSAPEAVQASLNSFFEAAAADLEITVENLSVSMVCLPQSRGQQARGVARVLGYTTSVLLPTLTSLFRHFGTHNYGADLFGKGYCATKNNYKHGVLADFHTADIQTTITAQVFSSLFAPFMS